MKKPSEDMDHIAVTGIGIISSIGNNVLEFKRSLKNGKCGIGVLDSNIDHMKQIKSLGALIQNYSYIDEADRYAENNKEIVLRMKSCLRRTTESMRYASGAVLESWSIAGLGSQNAPERTGIVVAGSNLSCGLQYSLHDRFTKAPEYLSPSYALQFMDTDFVGTLSEIFNIQGEGFTVGGASASGNVAIIKACQLIKLGVADVCLVVGCCCELSPMEIQSFINLGGMGGHGYIERPLEACRPFDVQHEGFIYGQASGCIVLESKEHAVKRNAKILSYICGGAIALDANRLSDSSEEGVARVMAAAIRQAGLDASDISYINAHGTSTPLGDITEVKAIKRVFGSSVEKVWINSTKSLTGHCLFSAGIIEAIAVIIQMNEGFLHPNLNLCKSIDHECRFCKERAVDVEIETALSNSIGFGGINTSIVISKKS